MEFATNYLTRSQRLPEPRSKSHTGPDRFPRSISSGFASHPAEGRGPTLELIFGVQIADLPHSYPVDSKLPTLLIEEIGSNFRRSACTGLLCTVQNIKRCLNKNFSGTFAPDICLRPIIQHGPNPVDIVKPETIPLGHAPLGITSPTVSHRLARRRGCCTQSR